MNKIKKIIKGLYTECKAKGTYHFFRMYLSNLAAILRGFKWKIVYPRNVKSSCFFIQSRSKIDIYSKNVVLIVSIILELVIILKLAQVYLLMTTIIILGLKKAMKEC